ncbi:MAG: site-2 protease family protein [Pirellulales bacterium]|nr:site-2 protease family protein [Pirellulales bacterium]
METPQEQPEEIVRAECISAGDTNGLTVEKSPPPRRRRIVLPISLFLATYFTTFLAGCAGWNPWHTPLTLRLPSFPQVNMTISVQPGDTYVDEKGQAQTAQRPGNVMASWWDGLRYNWKNGVLYMVWVMAILLFHEMGHFLMTLKYKISASLPFFIPIPNVFGTFGAVIGMNPNQANRKEVFDIGIAGPLAGLVITIPLLLYGLSVATPTPERPQAHGYGDPLLVKLLIPILHDIDEVKEEYAQKNNDPSALEKPFTFVVNPIYMAAWVGMFITAVNMFPVKQLDGGHVAYALFGPRAHMLGRLVILGAIAFITISGYWLWALMIILVIFMPDHPPTVDDRVRLGPWRYALGLFSLLIPVFCFTPFPFINLY